MWGSRIAVACSAVCFIAAIRVYCAPTSPCSGCSLSWCSHLPPSRHCFTWAHAISPNYDGWPQAPVIRRADLLHRLRQTRQFLLRCHASSVFIQLCVYASAAALAVSSMAFCASIPAMNEFVIIMTRVLFSFGTFAMVAAIFSASLSCSAVYLLASAMVFPPSVWCVVLLSLRLLYIAIAVFVNTFLLPVRFFVDTAVFLFYNSVMEVRK